MTGWQDVMSQLGKQGSVDDAKFQVSTASGSFKKSDKCLVNGQEMAEYLQVQVPDCPPHDVTIPYQRTLVSNTS